MCEGNGKGKSDEGRRGSPDASSKLRSMTSTSREHQEQRGSTTTKYRRQQPHHATVPACDWGTDGGETRAGERLSLYLALPGNGYTGSDWTEKLQVKSLGCARAIPARHSVAGTSIYHILEIILNISNIAAIATP